MLLEEGVGLLVAADEGRRILDPPMRGHRLARPDRADLVGGVVADGEDEIERRAPRLGELVPALRAQAVGPVVQPLQQPQRHRMDPALGMAAGREALEAALAPAVERALGHDAAGRVAGAQEQHVVDFVGHRAPHASSGSGTGGEPHEVAADLGMALAAIAGQEGSSLRVPS